MLQAASSPIPRITADLVTTSAVFGQLTAREALKLRCAVVQAVADRGVSLDELQVGGLLAIVLEARKHVG